MNKNLTLKLCIVAKKAGFDADVFKAYAELLKTQSSRDFLVALSHQTFVRNHPNFDTKRQMGSERRLFSLFLDFSFISREALLPYSFP